MDAREYRARKGLDGDRERERPTTLEEKAWARARESGDHRPRAGTPHDWEEWERYHDELAEDADSLEQKINHEAHQRFLEHRAREQEAQKSVKQFDPGAPAEASFSPAEPVPAGAPRTALLALAVLMPPLAVGLSRAPARRVGLSLLLTLLGWLPGVIHALRLVARR
ncbi:YqaE/Pmp3 family membrane protein [Halomonas sp. Y3]|uniref:YqaE/Pmp3 family membrane protein n=1 Tax=Halomonas sp. Y3 TaxID=2956797 RepID=UPI00209E01FA|nr:YqaE/Pmp3 family membrane protein [Halomonas sp. Y3]